MCVSFLIAFIVIFVVLSYAEQIEMINDDTENGSYKSELRLNFTKGSDKIDFDRLFNNVGGVILIEDVVVSADDVNQEYAASVIVHSEEPVMYASGKSEIDLKSLEDEEYPIVLGRYFSAVAGDKKEFSIDSVNYNVIGTERGYKSEAFDKQITLWYDKIGNFTKTHIDQSDLYTIKICSNTMSAETVYNNILKNIYDVCPGCRLIVLPEQSENFTAYEKKENKNYFFILYLFCIVNCMISAQFWVMERKHEIAVRRACGFSELKLFSALYADLLKPAAFSLILCILFKFIADIISTKIQMFSFSMSLSNIIFLAAAVTVSTFLAMLLPVISIGRAASVNSVIRKNMG